MATPLNDLVKKNFIFTWGAFNEFRKKLTNAQLLFLPNFDKTFEIESDANGLGIGAVLMHDEKTLMYVSAKLNGCSIELPYL